MDAFDNSVNASGPQNEKLSRAMAMPSMQRHRKLWMA